MAREITKKQNGSSVAVLTEPLPEPTPVDPDEWKFPLVAPGDTVLHHLKGNRRSIPDVAVVLSVRDVEGVIALRTIDGLKKFSGCRHVDDPKLLTTDYGNYHPGTFRLKPTTQAEKDAINREVHG